ncbi:hypothetical protein GCM10020367_59640 [Streptomyces sannanensis]|uniref:Recombinase zinc beta ribbon domain-containing protein n=1 Tax=Streptomyces sannanensis TaxID=285536 RepID=A0ABP6SJV9_9ACTN
MPVVELPDVGTLSQDQQRGRACVWCGVILDNGTARDLGMRRTAGVRWFPRACPQHAEAKS